MVIITLSDDYLTPCWHLQTPFKKEREYIAEFFWGKKLSFARNFLVSFLFWSVIFPVSTSLREFSSILIQKGKHAFQVCIHKFTLISFMKFCRYCSNAQTIFSAENLNCKSTLQPTFVKADYFRLLDLWYNQHTFSQCLCGTVLVSKQHPFFKFCLLDFVTKFSFIS